MPETPLGQQDARFRAGNLLICLRNAHVIVILDQETLTPTWSWGPGELVWEFWNPEVREDRRK